MPASHSKFGIVTGASAGIGYELARCCAREGYDLLIAADQPTIATAAEELKQMGAMVDAIEVDLSATEGVDRLYDKIGDRPVDALLANAGHGLGRSFFEQDVKSWRHVVDTNIIGTLYLVQKVGKGMKERGHGKILITGSIAGFMPGSFQAVYNASKAFLDSFSFALRNELKDSGVTVTCLMPGATETDFFERADMMDTKVGTSKKMDPAEVAKLGFDAMMNGDGEVIAGWQNKMRAAMGSVLPAEMTAEMHRKSAAPGTASKPHH